ncbi:MAG: hypothetical protein O3A00_15835, partial [Planctomycetota bacterium]|nr:hypothetical protein [Planctomycetota bacterium]
MAEPTDPLLRDVELPLVARRQLLGRPVEFHTNSRVVLEHVLDLTGGELKTSSADGFVPVARLVLIRHEVPATSLSHREVLYRMPQPNRLLISAGQSFGVVETDSAHGVAYLSDALIADREFLKRAFIEAMSLRLITGPERYPIHAALVGTGSNALLLTGNSGSGKSTLAYLASQRRLTTYSEDVVYVQRSPDVRIWTRPTAITLLPDVARKYSDIEHIPTTRLATGKDKVVINDGIQTGSEFLKRIGVCLLCP